MLKKFSTLNKVHDKVDTVRLLEHIVEANNKRMVYLAKNKLFDFKRFQGLMFNNYILTNDFHGVKFSIHFFANQIDLAKSATTYN